MGEFEGPRFLTIILLLDIEHFLGEFIHRVYTFFSNNDDFMAL